MERTIDTCFQWCVPLNRVIFLFGATNVNMRVKMYGTLFSPNYVYIHIAIENVWWFRCSWCQRHLHFPPKWLLSVMFNNDEIIDFCISPTPCNTVCSSCIYLLYIVGERGFIFHLKSKIHLSIFLFGKGPLNFFMYHSWSYMEIKILLCTSLWSKDKNVCPWAESSIYLSKWMSKYTPKIPFV